MSCGQKAEKMSERQVGKVCLIAAWDHSQIAKAYQKCPHGEWQALDDQLHMPPVILLVNPAVTRKGDGSIQQA